VFSLILFVGCRVWSNVPNGSNGYVEQPLLTFSRSHKYTCFLDVVIDLIDCKGKDKHKAITRTVISLRRVPSKQVNFSCRDQH
jgi:hypothetical protein